MKMKPKEERREIIRKALEIQNGERDGTIVDLAKEYGVTRTGVYKYLERVTENPEAQLRRAEREVLFRIEVMRLLGYTEGEIEAILESVEEERGARARNTQRYEHPIAGVPGLSGWGETFNPWQSESYRAKK